MKRWAETIVFGVLLMFGIAIAGSFTYFLCAGLINEAAKFTY